MTKVTPADIVKAWPLSAGGVIAEYDANMAIRAACQKLACDDQTGAAFVLKRIRAYALGSYVETTEPKYRTGWGKWLKQGALDEKMPDKWFQRNPAAKPAFESPNQQANREMGGGFQPGRRKVI